MTPSEPRSKRAPKAAPTETRPEKHAEAETPEEPADAPDERLVPDEDALPLVEAATPGTARMPVDAHAPKWPPPDLLA